jgi:general secretion pathway protein N
MRKILFVLAAVAGLLATALVIAPAQWAASALKNAAGGRIELADASGTAWSGSGLLVLASSPDPAAPRATLPERLSWRLSPWSLIVGQLDLTVTHPSALSQPLSVRAPLFGAGVATLSATTLRLPASLLIGVGAPWNTIRPGGILLVNWDRLQIGSDRIQGNVVAEWQYASSALTPVSPMGHYRLQTNGIWPGTQLDLLTISGPLELKGSGTIAAGGRLRFTGRAQAMAGTDPGVKAQLTGLISLLGRRDGEGALLNFGG